MSFANVPSKAEVMGWNPQTLADYMKKLKLSGCDRVVTKSSIDGAQFMHMTERDLQAFPCLFVPIITKIQTEINKGEHKKAYSHKSKPLKYLKQDKVFVQEDDVWESDEFDNDSDGPIYEGPEHEAEDYNCSVVEQQHSDRTSEAKYKLPAAGDPVKPPQPPRGPKPPDCQREPVPDPALTQRTTRPPLPSTPKENHILQKPLKPAVPASVHIDRSKKPGLSQKDIPKIKGSAVKDTVSKRHHPKVPVSTDVFNRPSKSFPDPSAVTQSTEEYNSIPRPRKALDFSWYGGTLTRYQAEVALREVNKDGAFVVRDSSKGSVEHPFTLMLLYQDKVYNIMIRYQGNAYTLGSGLRNSKSFPGVKEMITHHTHTPLLLIDATDQSHEAHPQSCLLHPARL